METNRKPPVIWLVDCGLPGHFQQVVGVGEILATRLGAECIRVECRLRLQGRALRLARHLLRITPGILAPALAKLIYRNIHFPMGNPDVLISSFTHTIPLCRLIARKWRPFSIFVENLAPRRAAWFDLVIAPSAKGLPNEFVPPVMPTGRSRSAALAAMDTHWPDGPPENCWGMVIGGDSRAVRFSLDDWKSLAGAMNFAAESHGIRWLVATSRRTGEENEALLRAHLNPAAIAEAAWWGDEPQRVLPAYLGAAGRVFITADSVTMISEALAIHGDAEAVFPSAPADEACEDIIFVRRLAAENLISLVPISGIGKMDRKIPENPLGGLMEDFESQVAEKVFAHLRKINRH